MPKENPLLGFGGERRFDKLTLVWFGIALVIGYLSNYVGVSSQLVAFSLFIGNYIPAVMKYAAGAKATDAILMVYLYCFISWPIFLYISIRYVGIGYTRKRVLEINTIVKILVIFVSGIYMAFVGLEVGGENSITLLSRLYYHKLFFSVFVVNGSFLLFTCAIFYLYHHLKAVAEKKGGN